MVDKVKFGLKLIIKTTPVFIYAFDYILEMSGKTPSFKMSHTVKIQVSANLDSIQTCLPQAIYRRETQSITDFKRSQPR